MKVTFQNFRRAAEGAVGQELLAAAQRVLVSGHYVLGPEVRAFEEEFSSALGARHAVGVASGLDALRLGLMASGVGPGDEVITTPFTAAATALAITHVGATPVFADVDPATLCLDASAASAAVTSRTRAILAVHLYGVPADVAGLRRVCERHGLAFFEDCAQAHLAKFGEAYVGTFGHWSAFSFYPTKNLGAIGDAGALVTNDDRIAEQTRCLRDYGQRRKYEHVEVGLNSRLDELQAALLRAKLQHLAASNRRRAEIVQAYQEGLRDLPLTLPRAPDATQPAWHLFSIRTSKRDALAEHLSGRSIATNVHYPKIVPDQECYRKAPHRTADACTVSRSAAIQCLSLPLYPELNDDEVEWVVRSVREFYEPSQRTRP